VVFALLLIGGLVALLAMGVCVGAIGLEARHVPNRPLHMRLNPLNILADQSLWTPRIRRLNRIGVRFGVTFIAFWLAAVMTRLFFVIR
jgi:hypothetical protein